jgi:hypothetical protein
MAGTDQPRPGAVQLIQACAIALWQMQQNPCCHLTFLSEWETVAQQLRVFEIGLKTAICHQPGEDRQARDAFAHHLPTARAKNNRFRSVLLRRRQIDSSAADKTTLQRRPILRLRTLHILHDQGEGLFAQRQLRRTEHLNINRRRATGSQPTPIIPHLSKIVKLETVGNPLAILLSPFAML